MSVLDKYNKGFKFNFQITDEHYYTSLNELVRQGRMDEVQVVRGMFINKKSKYGDAPIAVTPTQLVNLPKHLLGTFNDMMNDEGVVNLANAGKLGFKIYEYTGVNGIGYSINWVEL